MEKHPTTLRLLAAAAVCAASLASSSCVVQMHTGQALRDMAAVRTGVDTYHPVDGKVYCAKVDGKERLYMLAPEVIYTARHVAGEFYDTSGMVGPLRSLPVGGLVATGVEPTGRKLWVEVSLEEYDARPVHGTPATPSAGRGRLAGYRRCSFVRVVDSLPKGAKVFLDGETFDDQPAPAAFFGTFSERERSGAGLLTTLSHPLRYVVDPVCTAAATAVTYTTSVAGGAVAMPVASIVIEAMQGSGSCVPLGPEPWIVCEARGTSGLYHSADVQPCCASMLAESLDKSRIYTLHAHGLTCEQALAAARKLDAAGIRVNVVYYGGCSEKESVNLEIRRL